MGVTESNSVSFGHTPFENRQLFPGAQPEKIAYSGDSYANRTYQEVKKNIMLL